MRSRAYEIVHVIPGRVRIVVASHLGTMFVAHLAKLETHSDVTKVSWNEITGSVVIEYMDARMQLASILLILDGIFENMGYKVGGQDCKNDLFWSLMAGGTIAVAFIVKQLTPNSGLATVLETAAFGLTGYSVMNHCGGQNSPSRNLHLDSIAGLVSVLSRGSNRAFAGLFMTWLFNFMEITGILPLNNSNIQGKPLLRCGLTNV